MRTTLLLLLSGCGWADHSELVAFWHADIGGPAWSEDGSQIAVARHRWEQDRTPNDWVYGGYDTRNHRYVVSTTTLGGTPVPLSGELPGRPRSLHFQADAGYVLASAEIAVDNPNLHAWTRIGLNGSVLALRTEDTTHVPAIWLPDPTGDLVARVACNRTDRLAAQVDDGTGWSPPWGHCAVEWLDGADGTEAYAPLEVSFVWNDAIPAGVADKRWAGAAMWLPDGDLLVTDWLDEAVVITPGGAPRTAAVPSCHTPRTASSRVDGTGRRLGIVNGSVAVVDRGAPSFGCTP
jgi:hypothetical protein